MDLAFGASRRCRVVIRPGALERLADLWDPAWEAAAIIGDQNVLARFGDAVAERLAGLGARVVRLGFPAGEASKTRATKGELEDRLLDAGLGRRTCVVGLGGGVSLDLAGFVAATYLRGVDWLGVPTSLLAQVDASVGGKTGVNTPRGKNLVGAFHQPRAVLMDPAWPASLPAAEWRNGLAEMIKAAWIADRALFEQLEQRWGDLAVPGPVPVDLLARSVAIKAGLVQADEREGGPRAWLNFGHTAGHALERASGFELPHGRAVAQGMLIEARLATRRCGLAPEAVHRLARLLERLGFEAPAPIPFERAAAHLALDKKNHSGQIHVALPEAIGRMASPKTGHTFAVEPDALRGAWLP